MYAVADVADDAARDIVYNSLGTDIIGIATGNGTFVASTVLNVALGGNESVRDAEVADLNGDGDADILVLSGGAPPSSGSSFGRLSVFLADGSGEFNLPQSYIVGSNPREIAVADLDEVAASMLQR